MAPSSDLLARFTPPGVGQDDEIPLTRSVRVLHRLAYSSGSPALFAMSQLWLSTLVADSEVGVSAVRRIRRARMGLLRSGDLGWAARSLAEEARLQTALGDLGRAEEALSGARQLTFLGEIHLPPTARAKLLTDLGFARWRLSHIRAAHRAWQEGYAAAQKARVERQSALCRLGLGLCAWARGRAGTGYVQVSAALNWLRAHGRPSEVIEVLVMGAFVLADLGQWPDALVLLEEAHHLAAKTGTAPCSQMVALALAHARIAVGDLTAASAALDEARSLHRTMTLALRKARAPALLFAEGRLRLAQGRPVDALDRLREARRRSGRRAPILVRGLQRELLLAARSGATADQVAQLAAEALVLAGDGGPADPRAAPLSIASLTDHSTWDETSRNSSPMPISGS